MMAVDPKTDFPELVNETHAIWEQNGSWWDSNMGEGNKWHRLLIAPATERLLAIQGGEHVLDLACGNGQFARRLASMGARVLACDFSGSLVECARLDLGTCRPNRLPGHRSGKRRATSRNRHGTIRRRCVQHGDDGYGQHHALAPGCQPCVEARRPFHILGAASLF